MGAVQEQINKSGLRQLVPISALTPENFEELARNTVVEEMASGGTLFHEGDSVSKAIYLLSGRVVLKSDNKVVDTVVGGTEPARYPLAHHIPRQLTAVAKSQITYVQVDTQLLDVLLTKDNSVSYEVGELEDEDDTNWMAQMLRSKAFENLPPSNIQSTLMHLESVDVKAGDVVIRQGEVGDYYYIIRQGRCRVTRKTRDGKDEVTLAELTNGDSFGEEALISDARRNATITMMTDGQLMRLSKDDFDELMKKPLLSWVSRNEGAIMVKNGAIWLDVRLPAEHEKSNIPDSKNIPLSQIRRLAGQLDFEQKYIIYCDSGRRSSVAAFLLNQRGFDAYVLSGGYQAPEAEPVAPAAQATGKPGAEVIDIKTQQAGAAVQETGAQSEDVLRTETERLRQAEEQAKARAEEEARRREEAEAEVERLRAEQQEAIRTAESEARKREKAEAETKDIRKQAMAAKKRAEQEVKRLQKERESARKKAEEMLVSLREQQNAARQRTDDETRRLHAVAEAARREAEEEAVRLKAEVEAAQQKAKEEAARLQREQEAARKQAEEEAERLRQEYEAERQEAEEETARLKAEVEAAQKQAEEEAARLRSEAETAVEKAEADAKHQAEQEAARLAEELEQTRLEAEAEVARVRAEQEEIRTRNKEDIARLKAEAEEARLKIEEEARKTAAAEAARLTAEQEAAHNKADAEESRLKAEESAARLTADAEEIRMKAEEEAAQIKAEAEEARMRAEEEAARLKAEAEEARMRAEKEESELDEAVRLESEAKAARMEAVEAERQVAQAEETRAQAEAEARRMLEEAESVRQRAQEDAERMKVEADEARQRALDEAERVKREADVERRKAQEESARLKSEAEEAQKKTEAMASRLKQEANEIREKAKATIEKLQTDVQTSRKMAEVAEPVIPVDIIAPPEGEQEEAALGEAPEIIEPVEEAPSAPAAAESPSIDQLPGQPAALLDDADELAKLIDTAAQSRAAPESGIEALLESVDEDFRTTGGGGRKGMLAGIAGGALVVIGIAVFFLIGGKEEPAVPVEAVSPESAVPPGEEAAKQAPQQALVDKPKIVKRKASSAEQKERAPIRAKEFRDTLKDGSRAPVMVVIAGGEYEMGSPSSSTNFDERPRHKVKIPRFAISKYEVTVAEFRRYLRATKGSDKHKGLGVSGNHPAVNVSWKEAVDYAAWLSSQTGQRYRLPTEAEWEYAATAGTSTDYWWGAAVGSNRANCFGCGSRWDNTSTAPVASFDPNPYGLFNIAGNVMEWVEDCYHKNYQGAPADGSAWIKGNCTRRVMRGGAYNTPTDNLRSMKRAKYRYDDRLDNVGIRLARDY